MSAANSGLHSCTGTDTPCKVCCKAIRRALYRGRYENRLEEVFR